MLEHLARPKPSRFTASLRIPVTPANRNLLRDLRAAELRDWNRALPRPDAAEPARPARGGARSHTRGVMAALASGALLVCSLMVHAAESPEAGPLRALPRDSNGWFRVESPGEPGRFYLLEASTDLRQWVPVARTQDGVLPFADPTSIREAHRYYRVRSLPPNGDFDWKNQVRFPHDPFLSPFTGNPADDVRWIKFAIVLSEPARVYYQSSAVFPFHYDFAAKRLEPFRHMSRREFDRVSLHPKDQEIVLGAVLFPPIGMVSEYGIQLVGQEPYSKERVAELFDLVKSTVATDPGVKVWYMPAFEQAPSAQAERSFFESRGIGISSLDRWLPGNQTYSLGWAIGRLKFFSANEITKAFMEGRLLPGDILLTDGIPAEIPALAGVISLAASTPNSHVALLARSFGIPFVYLSDSELRAKALELVGKEVALRAGLPDLGRAVELIAVDPSLSPELKAELLNLKAPQKIAIPIKERLGAFVASADQLRPADIKHFGGKAANFGMLRQSIPSNAPAAIAFSFDLWDAFLDQKMAGGNTLRAEIQQRLEGFTFPPHMPTLAARLDGIRDMIRDDTHFAPGLQAVITNALVRFDAGRKIRFRSSTNVEDSEQFSGAGLYDSFSGCLADDTDGDDRGPSHCDPSESKERGVFRAIRKVYASFYNDNAYLERLRHGVNEGDVGMGLLVHHSTPDELELANGVATVRFVSSRFSTNITTELTTQLGARSVSNPDTSASPEVIGAMLLGRKTYLEAKLRSTLVPLGGYVMDWETDYRALMELLYAATEGFRQHHPDKTSFLLDFEYKKIRPGVLSVKQIRQIPDPRQSPDLVPYLLNDDRPWIVHQGEFGDVFSNHRLKSELSLQTRNLRLDEAGLARSIYGPVRIQLRREGSVQVMEGALPAFENAKFDRKGEFLKDQWTAGSGARQHRYAIETDILRRAHTPERVLMTLRDFRLQLSVDLPEPVPTINSEGKEITTTQHRVLLQPLPALDTPEVPVERVFRGKDGLQIQTRFFWRQPRRNEIGDKTAALLKWDQTEVSGLTSKPMTLRGYYSQTYRPGHHNFNEEFIFEPGLEEGLEQQTLAELKAANVQLIYVHWGDWMADIRVLGWDGKFRKLTTETSKPAAGSSEPVKP